MKNASDPVLLSGYIDQIFSTQTHENDLTALH